MNSLIEFFQREIVHHTPLLIVAGAAVAYFHDERKFGRAEPNRTNNAEWDERERLAEAIALFGHAPCR